MSTTITIRADEAMRQALAERAQARGTTVSELVRQILAESLAERPVGSRVGGLKGKLRLPADTTEPWRERLRERNWRR